MEFSVSDIIYDNIYHFACSDDYLKVLLEKQGYIEHITEIAEKYHLCLSYDDVNEIIRLEADAENTISEYAAAISEILNSVDAPKIKLPEKNMRRPMMSLSFHPAPLRFVHDPSRVYFFLTYLQSVM